MQQMQQCQISGILNEASDWNLKQAAIGICKDSRIDANPFNIEGCHTMPHSLVIKEMCAYATIMHANL